VRAVTRHSRHQREGCYWLLSNWPSRSRCRARGEALRNNPACVWLWECKPRTDKSSPTNVRNARGHGPTDRTARASARLRVLRDLRLVRLTASTNRCFQHARVRAVVSRVVTHSATPFPTAEPRIANAAGKKKDLDQAAARKCAPGHQPGRRFVRDARQRFWELVRDDVGRRCECLSCGERYATRRHNALRQADVWWHLTNRPSSSSHGRVRNAHRLRAGVLHHARL